MKLFDLRLSARDADQQVSAVLIGIGVINGYIWLDKLVRESLA